jgi:hypothetical protein
MQLCPHDPQLFASLPFTLTHVPLQLLSPVGHWHAPPFETLAQLSPMAGQAAQAAPPAPHVAGP